MRGQYITFSIYHGYVLGLKLGGTFIGLGSCRSSCSDQLHSVPAVLRLLQLLSVDWVYYLPRRISCLLAI